MVILKDYLNPKTPIENHSSAKPKRVRDWHEDDANEKGSIKGVDKPGLSTGFINTIDQQGLSTGLINRVDKRGLETLSINSVHKPLLKFADLRSNPLSLIHYFYRLTIQNDGVVTRRVKMSEIMLELHLSKDSARTALRFLLKNSLIKRVGYQIGKLGWSQYALEENLFNEMKEKGSINPVYEKGSNSSSSSLINNTATAIREDRQEINFEPLTNIGFTHSHLMQILKQKKLSEEMIQDSISYFAFDLKFNNTASEIKKGALKYFMGILLKGEMYNRPANYESAQDIAIRKYLEAKKAEADKKEQMERELLEIHLKEWIETLSEQQIKAIARSYNPSKGVESGMARSELREYFKQHEWSTKRAAIFK
jgi:hypothetical protein